MENSWFRITKTDSLLPNIVGEISSFKVIKELQKLPRFEMSVLLVSKPVNVGPIEFTLTITVGKLLKVYTCTVTEFEGTVAKGYILPKSSLFIRKSRSLSADLGSSLRIFNFRNNIDNIKISSIDPFLQLNETDAECFARIADYCGQGKLWGIEDDKIVICDIVPTKPELINIEKIDGLIQYNSSNTYEGDLSNKLNVNQSNNLFYKTDNIIIPDTCKFGRECLISYLEKRKLTEWCNITMQRKFKGNLNVPLGYGVQINNFSNKSLFIISKIEVIYSRYSVSYIYKISSYKGWNAYG